MQYQKCPICSFPSQFIFNSKHKKSIYECSNIICGHLFTPIEKEAQGICERATNIEDESDEFLRIYNERNIRLLKLFNKRLAKNSLPIKLLDFGAGNAHISRSIKKNLGDKCVIYCIESNPICSELYSKYQLTHIKKIEDLKEKVDLIYMIEVIEHCEDPITTLKNLSSKLTPGGFIFLSTPLGKSEESSTIAYDTKSHLHFFTERSLNLALKTAGLLEIKYQFFPQMYPLPEKWPLLLNYARITKSLLKKLLGSLGSKNSVSHLVGFTKKVG
jgi:SAM-dependent methyltransferase